MYISFCFLYTDRPMQCEVRIQQSDWRLCDLWGSWGPLHYGDRERTKDDAGGRRWMGPFHRQHVYHRWWVDQLLLQSWKTQAGRDLYQQSIRWWGWWGWWWPTRWCHRSSKNEVERGGGVQPMGHHSATCWLRRGAIRDPPDKYHGWLAYDGMLHLL